MPPPCAFTACTLLPALPLSRAKALSILSPPLRRTLPRTWRCTATSTDHTPTPSTAQTPPRRLRKGDVVDVVIEKLSYGGASVGYIAPSPSYAAEDIGLPIYAPRGACPGDTVRCALTKVRRRAAADRDRSLAHEAPGSTRSYAEARFVRRIDVSKIAVDAPCKHFGHVKLGGGGCGGCSAMNLAYAHQVTQKEAQMDNVYARVCAMYSLEVLPIVQAGQMLHYRNKMEFSFGRRWYEKDPRLNENPVCGPTEHEYTIGLHAPQRYNKVIQIEECLIQHPVGNEILNYIRERSPVLLLDAYDTTVNKGYFRNVAVRTSTNAKGELEVMVNLITSPCDVPQRLVPLATEIIQKFPSVVCVVQNVTGVRGHFSVEEKRERLLAGERKYIEQAIGDLVFRISANSFFQTNPMQAEVLYNKVREAAQLTSGDNVVDLFCGTGTIGLYLARHAKHVLGIDIVASAVEDARRNAVTNNISNAAFEQGNLEMLETVMKSSGVLEADVIIVDPPRAGLHPDLLKVLAQCQAKRIVYVSCNPTSQVRDLELLESLVQGKFRVSKIQPLDMFPNTPHVECVVTLERV